MKLACLSDPAYGKPGVRDSDRKRGGSAEREGLVIAIEPFRQPFGPPSVLDPRGSEGGGENGQILSFFQLREEVIYKPFNLCCVYVANTLSAYTHSP